MQAPNDFEKRLRKAMLGPVQQQLKLILRIEEKYNYRYLRREYSSFYFLNINEDKIEYIDFGNDEQIDNFQKWLVSNFTYSSKKISNDDHKSEMLYSGNINKDTVKSVIDFLSDETKSENFMANFPFLENPHSGWPLHIQDLLLSIRDKLYRAEYLPCMRDINVVSPFFMNNASIQYNGIKLLDYFNLIYEYLEKKLGELESADKEV